MYKNLVIYFCTSLLVACGGGGGSDGGGTGNNNGSGSSIVTSDTDYVFFTKNENSSIALAAYDPDAENGSNVTTIPTTNIQYKTAIIDANVDLTTLSESNLHTGRIFYADNGTFKSVSTAKADSLTITRHSTYSFTGILCSPVIVNNYLVFTDSGSDAICGNGNDSSIHAVTTNMSNADTIYTLAARPTSVLYSDATTTTGLLSVINNNLVYTDPSGAKAQTLQMGVTMVTEMQSLGQNVLLDVDGQVKIFNAENKVLSTSLHSANGTLSSAISDGIDYYFFDNQTLYSVALNANSSANMIGSDTGSGDLHPEYLINNYLIYTRSSQGSKVDFDAMDITNGTPNLLVSNTTSSTYLTLVGHNADKLYYSISDTTMLSNSIAGYISADGTNNTTFSGSTWDGMSFNSSTTVSGKISLNSLILQKYTFNNGILNGGDISVYDAATGSVRNTQGAIPPGYLTFSGFGYGNKIYGVFFNLTNASLAGIDVAIDNSMKQIDMSTTTIDQLIL